jgi:glycosyltransferase involved in cell wall biosynthesis
VLGFARLAIRPGDGRLSTSEGIRVLRIFSRLNVGGPAVHVVLLAEGLDALGYRTTVALGAEAPWEGDMRALAAGKGVRVVDVPGLGREIRPFADARALWSLYRMMRSLRPHIVHTHTAKAGVLGRLAARLAGVRHVVHTYHGHVLRGYFDAPRQSFFRAVERRLARGTAVLVAVSESVKADLVGLGIAPGERIRVIPLGLELQPLAGALPRGGLRREAGVPEGAPLVGIVGRLTAIKDVPTFLAAAARVRARVAGARFAVVGDGELRAALESRAAELGLAAAARFHGWRHDMAAVYGDLDVVVNTSRNEGTPVALIEAMAAGRPVVATRVGGTPDLLGNGARGRLVPAGDADAVADAIAEALAFGPEVAARVDAARAYVLAEHAVSRLVRDVDALYREMLEGRPAAAA